MSEQNHFPDEMKDRAVNLAADYLADDDLEGFALVVSTDGETEAMSFTAKDYSPEQFADHAVCGRPRDELIGKLLAYFALMHLQHPENIADRATRVAANHFDVDSETIETLRQQIVAENCSGQSEGGQR